MKATPQPPPTTIEFLVSVINAVTLLLLFLLLIHVG